MARLRKSHILSTPTLYTIPIIVLISMYLVLWTLRIQLALSIQSVLLFVGILVNASIFAMNRAVIIGAQQWILSQTVNTDVLDYILSRVASSPNIRSWKDVFPFLLISAVGLALSPIYKLSFKTDLTIIYSATTEVLRFPNGLCEMEMRKQYPNICNVDSVAMAPPQLFSNITSVAQLGNDGNTHFKFTDPNTLLAVRLPACLANGGCENDYFEYADTALEIVTNCNHSSQFLYRQTGSSSYSAIQGSWNATVINSPTEISVQVAKDSCNTCTRATCSANFYLTSLTVYANYTSGALRWTSSPGSRIKQIYSGLLGANLFDSAVAAFLLTESISSVLPIDPNGRYSEGRRLYDIEIAVRSDIASKLMTGISLAISDWDAMYNNTGSSRVSSRSGKFVTVVIIEPIFTTVVVGIALFGFIITITILTRPGYQITFTPTRLLAQGADVHLMEDLDGLCLDGRVKREIKIKACAFDQHITWTSGDDGDQLILGNDYHGLS
ncbi:hypothetical protein HK096_007367, partial [Nowakowskiella sp. JEL0078]